MCSSLAWSAVAVEGDDLLDPARAVRVAHGGGQEARGEVDSLGIRVGPPRGWIRGPLLVRELDTGVLDGRPHRLPAPLEVATAAVVLVEWLRHGHVQQVADVAVEVLIPAGRLAVRRT